MKNMWQHARRDMEMGFLNRHNPHAFYNSQPRPPAQCHFSPHTVKVPNTAKPIGIAPKCLSRKGAYCVNYVVFSPLVSGAGAVHNASDITTLQTHQATWCGLHSASHLSIHVHQNLRPPPPPTNSPMFAASDDGI